MTLEHLGVAIALRIPVVVALLRADLAARRRRDGPGVRAVLFSGAGVPARVVVVSSVTGAGYDALEAAVDAACGDGSETEASSGGEEEGAQRPPSSSTRPSRRALAGTVLGGTVVGGDVRGATVFAADVLVLAAPDGGLAAGFEAVVHADAVRQAARLLFADGAGGVAAGSTRKCTFEFLYHPEYLVPGTRLILRDGRTRAVGTVVSVDV
ncbi:GTPase [Aureococcus anophagefferens]|uniref:GTPase n=1 Tax=Aureococcus anophagefferens TaxID=44056 RepID=A0ABR1G609_AURAN